MNNNVNKNLLEANETSSTTFFDTYVTFAVVGRGDLKLFGEVLEFIKANDLGSIVYQRVEPPFKKLWITEKEQEEL